MTHDQIIKAFKLAGYQLFHTQKRWKNFPFVGSVSCMGTYISKQGSSKKHTFVWDAEATASQMSLRYKGMSERFQQTSGRKIARVVNQLRKENERELEKFGDELNQYKAMSDILEFCS